MQTIYETLTVRQDNILYWTINYNNYDKVYTTDGILGENTYKTMTELFQWLAWHWIDIDKHIFW